MWFWTFFNEIHWSILLTIFIIFTFYCELYNSSVTSLLLTILFIMLNFLNLFYLDIKIFNYVDSVIDFSLQQINTVKQDLPVYQNLIDTNILSFFYSFIFLFVLIYLLQLNFSKQNKKMEFMTLIFFIFILGNMLLQVTDLLEAFVVIETLSFIAYILAGFEKDTKIASSVGIQYLIIGSIASIFLFLAMIMFYNYFSTIQFIDLINLQLDLSFLNINNLIDLNKLYISSHNNISNVILLNNDNISVHTLIESLKQEEMTILQNAKANEDLGTKCESCDGSDDPNFDKFLASILIFAEWFGIYKNVVLGFNDQLNFKVYEDATFIYFENFYHYLPFLMSLGFLIGALLYKIKGAPFHIWAPTIYTRMPTASFVVLISIFTIFFSIYFFFLFYSIFSVFDNFYVMQTQIFSLVAILSLIFAFLGAFNQKLLKKFLIYSSIGHVAFLLFTFTNNTFFSNIVFLLSYLFIYTLSSVFLWYLITANNKNVTFLTNIIEHTKQNSLFYFIFTVIVFSMSGIPPLAGFFIKFDVLNLIIFNNDFFLAFLSLLITVGSFYYYLRMLKIVTFENFKIFLNHNYKIENFWINLRYIWLFFNVSIFLIFFINILEQSVYYWLSYIII